MRVIKRTHLGVFFIDQTPKYDEFIFDIDQRVLELETTALALTNAIKNLKRGLRKAKTKSARQFIMTKLKKRNQLLQSVRVEKSLIA